MTDRGHFYRVLEDDNGNPLRGAAFTIKKADGTAFTDALYTTNDGSATLANPGTTPDGLVEFFLTNAQRVLITFTAPGASQADTALVDVEAPHSLATMADMTVTNVAAAGQVLTATSATQAAWSAGGGGGGSTVDPGDSSTVPMFVYLKDTANVVWEVGVDTQGHLTTAVFAVPLPVFNVTIEDSNSDGGGVSFAVSDYAASDTFVLTYANQGYLQPTPADGDYAPIGTFTSSNTTQLAGSGDMVITAEPIAGLHTDSNDFGSHILHVRVVHFKGSTGSAFAEGTLQGAGYGDTSQVI